MSEGTVNHHLFIRENKPVSFSEKTMKKVRMLISRYPEGEQRSALLPVLHIAQEELGGYLTVDIMDYVAELLELKPIEVYEVATFHSMFYLEKAGKYVLEVCRTGPCAFCGGEEIMQHLEEKLQINTGETTPDGLFTLKAVECLGACGTAPNMQVNTEFEEELTIEKVDRILEHLRSQPGGEKPEEKTWAGKY